MPQLSCPPQNTHSGFADLGLSSRLVAALKSLGITEPTPIQAQAIRPLLEGMDLVGIAQTGTGKTLAFGLPVVSTLKPGDLCLVLAPTRELAQQIAETFRKLHVRVALLVGGENINRQIPQLRNSPQVIIATPGRLEDHMQQRTVQLQRVRQLVLDEADRMLDMGFAPAIKRIVAAVPNQRQTMLFSATMPKEIAALAESFLKNPVRVEIETAGTAAETVTQEVVVLPHPERKEFLRTLLNENRGSILVFVRTRYGARNIARQIRQFGHSAGELHSDRTLGQRREALAAFKSGKSRVLVATDIAARGIDVKDISLVINFDLPDQAEDYVHRIGRTGRAGAAGHAISLATPEQGDLLKNIQKVIGQKIPVSDRSTAEIPDGRSPRRPVATFRTKSRPNRRR